jgi:glycosyltransferase involved in cell wall biosynthesis
MLRPSLRGKAAGGLLRRAADVVVACSTPCADALRASGARPLVVHNGVHLPAASSIERGAGPLRVGTAGTVSRRKGSDVFVAAAERVAAELPGSEFRMAGELAPEPETRWARSVVASAERSGVHHLGHVDLARELAGLDVFVLPAREDPFPLVVLEAMSASLPVVGTAVDGISEQVTPDTGILVPPNEPEAVARAIIRLGRDPDLRRKMGEAGRRRVEGLFTVERQAAGLHQAYLEALEARPPGRPGRILPFRRRAPAGKVDQGKRAAGRRAG